MSTTERESNFRQSPQTPKSELPKSFYFIILKKNYFTQLLKNIN